MLRSAPAMSFVAEGRGEGPHAGMKRDVAALAAREHDLLVIGGGIYGVTAAYEAASPRACGWRSWRPGTSGAGPPGTASRPSTAACATCSGSISPATASRSASAGSSCAWPRRSSARCRFLVPAYGHGPKGREALAVGLLLDNLLGLDRNAGLPAGPAAGGGTDARTRRGPGPRPRPAARRPGGRRALDRRADGEQRAADPGFPARGVGAGRPGREPLPGRRASCRRAGASRGARVRDAESGQSHDVRAACVLLAAGPRAAQALVPSLPAGPAAPGPEPRAARGPGRSASALGVGARSGGRFLFLVPWRDHILAGTDYRPAAGMPESKGPRGRRGRGRRPGFQAEIARPSPGPGSRAGA